MYQILGSAVMTEDMEGVVAVCASLMAKRTLAASMQTLLLVVPSPLAKLVPITSAALLSHALVACVSIACQPINRACTPNNAAHSRASEVCVSSALIPTFDGAIHKCGCVR